MTKIETLYSHNEKVHNLESSSDLVSFLYDTFRPSSVLDVGCGLGNFLYGFKKLGVMEVKGVDGPWVKREKRLLYIEDEEFLVHDLQLPLELNKKYDLVISLEVGEHLSESAAKTHVQNLISAGNIIVFSAAVPFQGGQNHINEQWPSYWENIFAKYDFLLNDVIRPNIWSNTNIPWWYRQNSFLYVHKDVSINDIKLPILRDVIHPELYMAKVNNLREKEVQFKAFQKGKFGTFKYFKILLKSIIKRFQCQV